RVERILAGRFAQVFSSLLAPLWVWWCLVLYLDRLRHLNSYARHGCPLCFRVSDGDGDRDFHAMGRRLMALLPVLSVKIHKLRQSDSAEPALFGRCGGTESDGPAAEVHIGPAVNPLAIQK